MSARAPSRAEGARPCLTSLSVGAAHRGRAHCTSDRQDWRKVKSPRSGEPASRQLLQRLRPTEPRGGATAPAADRREQGWSPETASGRPRLTITFRLSKRRAITRSVAAQETRGWASLLAQLREPAQAPACAGVPPITPHKVGFRRLAAAGYSATRLAWVTVDTCFGTAGDTIGSFSWRAPWSVSSCPSARPRAQISMAGTR